MKTATQLIQDLTQTSQNTPYVITPTDTGFTMSINIADAKWYTLLYKNGLKKVFTIDAKLDESKHSAQTTDTLYELDWQGGADAGTVAPRLGGQIKVQKGEVWSYQAGKQYGVSEDGKVGETASYSFSSSEAKKWLDTQLKEAGWHRTLGKEAKGAAIVAGLTIAILVIAGLYLLLT